MQVLNIFHVLIAIALVALVLVQRGQGATAGAAFGSGASGTVFGARGAGNFLTRTTWVLAALFCAISLTMAVVVSRTSSVPETDLGVVSSSQTESISEDTPDPGATLEVEGQTGSDVPALEIDAEPIGDGGFADDLPGFDSAGDEAIGDEGAVESGADGEPGPGTDDSN